MKRVRLPSPFPTADTFARRSTASFALALFCCGAQASNGGLAGPGLSTGAILVPVFLASASIALLALHRRQHGSRRMNELERQLARVKAANAALREQLAVLTQREEAARANAERFRSLTSLSADWYWEQDEQYRFTMRTTWVLGEEPLSRAEFIGRCRWELDGIVGDPDWNEHRRTLEARQPFRGFEYQYRHASRLRWVSINGEPMFDESGRFTGYRGTGRDITRRKHAEAALRASEERFNEIIGSMPVGLFIKDPDSRVILMNRECERQWGIAFAEVEGTDGSHIFTPAEMAAFRESDRSALSGRRSVEFEETRRNIASGEMLTVKAIKKPVFDETGDPRYLICITVDITERKRAEEQLRQSRESLRQLARHQTRVKEEERKRIARDIHDELGQNLMALRLEVSAIANGAVKAGTGLERRAQLMMATVDHTIRSVRHIINDLRPAVLDLGLIAALEWQMEEFCRRTALSCSLDVDVDDKDLVLDDTYATTLFRVLQESLTNVQRHAAATAVQVRLHRDAACVYLTVSDNGLGGVTIDGRRSKQAFGLLGMGERLRMLGGTLDIGNRPQGGTELVACVPLAGVNQGGR